MIFWAPLTVILMVIGFILILFYPILRHYYHHGIYDGLEGCINKMVISYLSAIAGVLRLCTVKFEANEESKKE